METPVAISISNVSKTFKLPHEKQTTIKSAIVNLGRAQRGYEHQEALKNISFEIHEGDFFGIVGRNGSGKSTLLKLLAGIYTPTEGSITVNGRLTPFIELGVGFNQELSGRENVFLNGALLGFSRKEMEAMYPDIVEFAEIERFMDQKLKNYSSGMQVRLAFSIAIRAQTDILLIDEVLAVGDAAFQMKCFDYFEQLKEEKRTVVLVSHDMGSIKRFCNNAVLIDKGRMIESGDVEEVVAKYALLNRPKDTTRGTPGKDLAEYEYLIDECAAELNGNELTCSVRYHLDDESSKTLPAVVGFSILNDRGMYICGFNNLNSYLKTHQHDTRAFSEECSVDISKLFPGNYLVNISLYTEKFEMLNHKNYASSFTVKGKRILNKDGAYNVDLKWASEKAKV